MATPFFRGNYGSALSRVDTRPILEAGRARGQMFAGLGKELGGMIKEYGLNKEKRAELTGEIEAMLPRYMQELTMSGNEDSDKKNMLRIEKFKKGDSSMSDLKGLAGELAMKDKVQARIAQNEATEIANQTNRFNLDLARELKDSRVAQAKLTNDLRRLALTEGKAVSPAKIKDILDRYSADAATRPSEIDATIAEAKGVVRDQDVRNRYSELRGGPMGVAAQQATEEDLRVEQMEANIDRTRGLTSALDVQMDLIRRPVDTSIPGNVDIAKEIKAISSDIASLESEETRVKDPNDEDKYLKIKDFFIYDDYEQKYVVNEKLKEKLSPRLEAQFDALRLAYDKQTQLRMNELVPIDLKQKDGSSKTEFVPRREYLRLLKLKEDAEAAAADEAAKQRDANIRKNTIFGRTDNRLMGQPKF